MPQIREAFVVLLAGLACQWASAAAVKAPPTPEEQTAIIAATRRGALEFSDHLPDFICTQVTRRWVNQKRGSSSLVVAAPRGRMSGRAIQLDADDDWKLRDTLTVQLTYFGQKEQYKLLLVNGLPAKQSYESLNGTTQYGDFGSVLGILFQDSSAAAFTWDHWATLDNQAVMVFAFAVDAGHSQWHIGYETQEVVTAFKGQVYIEPTQHQVLKIKVNADQIPKKFPVQRSGVELDYRAQTVGEHEFFLPLRSVNWSDTKNLFTRNEVEFRRYRRFSTDSKIDFDTPAPLPDAQIKEAAPDKEH